MAYFEVARTIPPTSTQANVGVANAVAPAGTGYRVTGYGLIYEPQTLDDLLALPVHHDVICPECKSGGVSIRGEVCQCRCGMRWRWPAMGLD